MNLSSSGLIDTFEQGPLCPNDYGDPQHPSHQLRVRFADAVHEATPRNADGEPASPELDAVNNAVAYGPTTDNRMRLYRATVQAMDVRGTVTVEALFFRCQICGLVLPASRAPRVAGTEPL